MDGFLQDLRYAGRALLKQKAFSATAALTLAVGIGANTAIFSVVDGVVLRPLPFPNPDRLVQLSTTSVLSPQGEAVAWSDLEAFRRESGSFESIAGYAVSARYLRVAEGSKRVMTVRAEREFFATLGAQPLAGRTFRPDDPGDVAVAGEQFWRQRLGADPSAIGRSILLDGEPFTIVGIMPDAFQFPYRAASLLPGVRSEGRTDLWTPLVPQRQPRGRLSYVIARLKPSATLAAAERELRAIVRRLDERLPAANRGHGARLVQLSDAIVAASIRRPLFFLFGAVALVLALACANVANLSLVRLTLRRREIAVQAALGAGPLRLLRQLLLESVILTVVGGTIGLVLGFPIAQNWSQVSELGMSLVVRTQGPPLASADAVRAAIRAVDPTLAIFGVSTMERVVADSLADFTLFLRLMGAFAAVGLLLASTGTLAVISYISTSRRREFAIRVALGADRRRVLRMIVGRGLGLTAVGLLIGLTAAFGAAPFVLDNLPVTVHTPDTATLGPVAFVIFVVALAACLVPARRAANTDPMSMLRRE